MAILTNAGGPGILAADACERHGLELAPLAESTRQALRAFLPPSASVGNPIDMLASAPAEHYRQAAELLLADDAVESLLVIFIPPLVTDADAVARAIVEVSRGAGQKPVLGVFMRAEGAPPALAPIPCYAFPESAAIALARVAEHAEWRRQPAGESAAPAGIDRDAAKRIVSAVLERGGGWLSAAEALQLMSAIGVTTPSGCAAANAEDAVAAARRLGFPVAIKALGPALLHKTERRAVLLDIKDAAGVRAAYADFVARFGVDLTGVLVQRMVPDGVEMLVGATLNPLFGPVVVCGSGGVLVDLLGDSAVRLHPVTRADAREMVQELKAARLLSGYRGMPPADENALYDVIERVSALLEVCPEIAELDLNPVKVLAQGASAVDVRVRVEKERPRSRSRRVSRVLAQKYFVSLSSLLAAGSRPVPSQDSVKQSFPIRTLSLNEVGLRFRQKLDGHREPLGFAVRCRAPRHVDLHRLLQRAAPDLSLTHPPIRDEFDLRHGRRPRDHGTIGRGDVEHHGAPGALDVLKRALEALFSPARAF